MTARISAPLLLFFLALPLCSQVSLPFPTTLVFPPYFHSYGIQRATQAKLRMLLPFRTRFDDPQGVAVTKMETRNDTAVSTDDDEVTVYGVNRGRGEIIYNTSMYAITVWGEKGSGPEEMNNPKGVACDPVGNVYICDAGNNRILRLFNPKTKVQFVKSIGAGILKNPTHIALGGKGELYVADTDNHRILVMDCDGKILREIRIAGKIPVHYPLGIAVNLRSEKWHCDPKRDSILVLYYQRDCLFFLNDSGKSLVRLDLNSNQAFCVKPDSVVGKTCAHDFMAADFYGNVYLPDKNRGTVDKFDINLSYLTSFGGAGHGDRQFDEPRGICIWKRYGQTFVAEKEGAQYYWVGTDFSDVKVVRYGNRLAPNLFFLTGMITEPSYLSLYLLAGKQDTVQAVFKKRMCFPRPFETLFSAENLCSRGDRWLAVFEPTYSSYTYFQKAVEMKR
jgi:hypothetical protein